MIASPFSKGSFGGFFPHTLFTLMLLTLAMTFWLSVLRVALLKPGAIVALGSYAF